MSKLSNEYQISTYCLFAYDESHQRRISRATCPDHDLLDPDLLEDFRKWSKKLPEEVVLPQAKKSRSTIVHEVREALRNKWSTASGMVSCSLNHYTSLN